MQLYLQEQQLEAAGIHHFDEWVSLYAQPKMAFEMKLDGGGFRMHTRLATFVNLPELSDIPSILQRLRGRIAEACERIATIDRELTRLEI